MSASPHARALTCLALLLGTTGCHSYLIPFDERPLVSHDALPTQGGERLALDARGRLVLRPKPGDVSAALGASLHTSDAGVIVTHRLAPHTLLRPRDRIVWVAPVLPAIAPVIEKVHLMSLGHTLSAQRGVQVEKAKLRFSQFEPGALVRKPPTAAPPADGAALRARPGAHRLQRQEELAGYLCATGWLALDLLVIRGGEEVVVRQRLREERKPVHVALWHPESTRWQGLDLVRVWDLPEENRPAYAENGSDLLVVRVARDSPAGRAGLRPLDLVTLETTRSLIEGGEKPGQLSVQAPGGRAKLLNADYEPRDLPTEIWFPFLYTWEHNVTRWHIGIGPWDAIFHASHRWTYYPSLNVHQRTSRWSAFTVFGGAAARSESGTVDSGGVSLLIDPHRMQYASEWINARDEARLRTKGR